MAKFLIYIGFLLVSIDLIGGEILKLKVGEQKIITLTSYESIKVSRKGVIDLDQVEDNLWRVSALKKGSVVVSTTNFDGFETKIIFFVENPLQNHSKTEGKWYQFVCEYPGISCQKFIITGSVSSWQWFYQSKKWCDKNSPCLFKVKLVKEGRANLEEYLTSRLSLRAYVHDDHRISIEGKCDDKKQKHSYSQLLDDYIFATCRSKFENIKLKAKIFWLKEDHLRKFGFNIHESLNSNLLESFQWNLNSYLVENRQHLLAEPEIITTLGNEALVRIGTNTLYEATEHRSEILKNGLTLKVRVLDERGKMLKLKISLDLSQAKRSVQSADANEYQGELWMERGQKKIVASLNMNQSQSEDQESPIFSQIPIIAPIFSKEEKSKLDANIYIELWLPS